MQSYDIWFLRYGVWQAESFILDCFLPFYTSNNSKNQTFEKLKKTPGDIIILHMWTINDNHMVYVSWDIEHNGQNFWSLWTVFYPFTPLTTRKINILKKWKKKKMPGDIIIIHKCTKNHDHMLHRVPEIQCMMDVILIFYFGLLLPFYPPNDPKNQNFFKNEKNTWIYHHFTHVYQKQWSRDLWFLRYGVWQMDRRTEKVTYRGGCPT